MRIFAATKQKRFMKSGCSILLITILCISGLWAQYNPLAPPNTYASEDNPHYWKNKKPYEGYWQQDVHYKISAYVDETTDIINGVEQLVYTCLLYTSPSPRDS